mmetsp:Transcript_28395/g.66979  ORF Transcript_28395/g.66979 Transcript_28395/m.66979 type:complete len:227 (+) Transcript_28395:269-949(+)
MGLDSAARWRRSNSTSQNRCCRAACTTSPPHTTLTRFAAPRRPLTVTLRRPPTAAASWRRARRARATCATCATAPWILRRCSGALSCRASASLASPACERCMRRRGTTGSLPPSSSGLTARCGPFVTRHCAASRSTPMTRAQRRSAPRPADCTMAAAPRCTFAARTSSRGGDARIGARRRASATLGDPSRGGPISSRPTQRRSCACCLAPRTPPPFARCRRSCCPP